jgi:hypothetical protein
MERGKSREIFLFFIFIFLFSIALDLDGKWKESRNILFIFFVWFSSPCFSWKEARGHATYFF